MGRIFLRGFGVAGVLVGGIILAAFWVVGYGAELEDKALERMREMGAYD